MEPMRSQNPRRRLRRYYAESGESKIWLEFFLAILPTFGVVPEAAKRADDALADYRRRYPEPVREVEEEPPGLDEDEPGQGSMGKPQ